MGNQKKLAFCFLCRENINNIKLWKKFFEGYEDLCDIYVHRSANYAHSNDFFSRYSIPIYSTDWGDIYCAICAIYRQGLARGNNKFILLSGSCIPVKHFSSIYSYLQSDDLSHIFYQPHLSRDLGERATLLQSLKRYCSNAEKSESFSSEFDVKHWYFNDAWTILNRRHAQLIVDNYEIVDSFRRHNCFAYDENLPSYILSMYDELQNAKRKCTTFVNWREKICGENGRFHPKTYSSLSKNDLEEFKPYLFARKIEDIENICDIVNLDLRMYRT